jgi:tungstate transport system ATP-binding protein
MTNAYHLHNIKVSLKKKEILSIDDLAIKANQCTALFGGNGAGKSTLLRLLAFTHQASQGEVLLFNETVSWPLKPKHRKRIAFVEQQPFLLEGTVYDNIKLGLSLQQVQTSQHKTLIEHALEQTHTAHLSKQNTQTLSGGELKRVAIARALAYQPDILLLDEPFSHLDYDHIDLLAQHLQSFCQQTGKTVVLSTHDHLQGMALSQQTINLRAGKVSPPLVDNIFNGRLEGQNFFTDKLCIHTTSKLPQAQHIAIDPRQIIISNEPLQSSMQNNFSGRIIFITEQSTTVRLVIDCDERFHVIISLESISTLQLKPGNQVYLSFKASAVSVF